MTSLLLIRMEITVISMIVIPIGVDNMTLTTLIRVSNAAFADSEMVMTYTEKNAKTI